MLPLCAATLIAVVALAFLVASQSSKIDAFLDRAPQQTTMPVPPEEIIYETSWCHKVVREPPLADLHTTIIVRIERNPGESQEDHWARYLAAVAAEEAEHPNNCSEH